jgi:GTPase SAR1 family protein
LGRAEKNVQANIELSEGKRRLAEIIEAFPAASPHWNEAQNRFQFVDRLLIECLGWEHPLIEVEKTDEGGGRADYLLGKPVKAAVEAKRESKLFAFPPTYRSNASRKLRSLTEACPNLKGACTQVITYCAMHGAQIAVVCNGPQLVLFQSNISGQSPLDGDCYVFDGFQDYLAKFAMLWKFLSPEGMYENLAFKELVSIRNPRIPQKALTQISEPQGYRYRTSFQENLRTLASILLDDIEENPEIKNDFYNECYVPIDANNRHILLSKKAIASRYRRVSDNGISPAKLAATVRAGKVEVETTDIALASAKPIVIIGDVGVGKTSFFENLYQQTLETDGRNTCFLNVNLGQEAALSANVNDYVLSELPKRLKEDYSIDINSKDLLDKIYLKDLIDFENSPEGQLKTIDELGYVKERIKFLAQKRENRSSHLLTSLDFIARSLKHQIIVVLDNADQRTFQTQQDAFVVAQELASLRSLLVFVALRPATFYTSKLSGALSGYQNQVLTISPPPADEVIRKRIAFALRVAEGRIGLSALKGVSIDLSNIVLFLKATLRSIKTSGEIRTFLSNITGGNTRLVIELFTSFCGSPNVDSERIVEIELRSGDYKIPLHEFTKHALLGEYSFYNPTSSLVACNVFDVSTADFREHFLAPMLIAYISSPLGIRDNDGFISGASILDELVRIGFTDTQVRFSLRKLARRRLIETPHAHYREIEIDENVNPETFFFRATSVGIYHIRYWVGAFSFLDASCIDTPIFDEVTRVTVFENAQSFDIARRYAKAHAFGSYLLSSWHEANFDVSYYDFSAILDSQYYSFSAVKAVLDRGPRARN